MESQVSYHRMAVCAHEGVEASGLSHPPISMVCCTVSLFEGFLRLSMSVPLILRDFFSFMSKMSWVPGLLAACRCHRCHDELMSVSIMKRVALARV